MNDQHRILRLGLVLAAGGLPVWLFLLFSPRQDPVRLQDVIGGSLVLLMSLSGVGLIREGWPVRFATPRRSRVGRWGGTLFFISVVAGILYQFATRVAPAFALPGWDLQAGLGMANAVATTLLILWCCYRAAALLLRRREPRSAWPALITRVLFGLALCAAAVNHLMAGRGTSWVAGGESFTASISTSGMALYGFVGWKLWYAAVLLAALALISCIRRIGVYSGYVLAFLFLLALALLIPKIAAQTADVGWMLLAAALPPLGLAGLSWWLAAELRADLRRDLKEPTRGGEGAA